MPNRHHGRALRPLRPWPFPRAWATRMFTNGERMTKTEQFAQTHRLWAVERFGGLRRGKPAGSGARASERLKTSRSFGNFFTKLRARGLRNFFRRLRARLSRIKQL